MTRRFRKLSLDRIIADLERTKEREEVLRKSTAPPTIFVSTKPAILVLIDGEPVLAPVNGTGLEFAVNTNWDLFYESSKASYYLLNGDSWLTSEDLAGPWKPTGKLPESFSHIPMDENWDEVRKYVVAGGESQAEAPEVFVTTKPAELITIDGEPEPAPIEGTNLSYVANTDSDLFHFNGDGKYYYLVAGRWFRSDSLQGPWVYASTDLPDDFAKIPQDGSHGGVLASVPGTSEAEKSIAEARIPRKAVVNRERATLSVAYQGEPRFRPIEGTSMTYAANTPNDVIYASGKYYACHNGVWFVSDSPSGPWIVCDSVAPEIYSIPPSSPVYRTTYVRVYGATSSEVVVGYTSGYLGSHVLHGSIVYGTAIYYPGFVWVGPRPVYFARPFTYGVGAYYNPKGGTFRRAGASYGPYGGIGRGALYNPATGSYVRSAAAWGSRRGLWGAEVYAPAGGASRTARRQSRNLYNQWTNSLVSRGVKTGRLRSSKAKPATVKRGRIRQSVRGGSPKKNLFVGKNGNIYKRGRNGWAKYGGSKKPGLKRATRKRASPGVGDRKQLRGKRNLRRTRTGIKRGRRATGRVSGPKKASSGVKQRQVRRTGGRQIRAKRGTNTRLRQNRAARQRGRIRGNNDRKTRRGRQVTRGRARNVQRGVKSRGGRAPINVGRGGRLRRR
ncbi:hypothetical protein ACFL2Q_19740 [Thermodesulfobacteriota bacterium]